MHCACRHDKGLTDFKLYFTVFQDSKAFPFNAIKYFIVFRMSVKRYFLV